MTFTDVLEGQDYETLCAFEHHEKYLRNDTALSCFFIHDKVIFKDMQGAYYYSTIVNETQKEFVYFDDLALAKELTPVDDEKVLSLIETLEDRNSIIKHFNFNLMEIRYEGVPLFVVYNEDMQIFVEFNLDSFNTLDETLCTQLAKLSPMPNTFDKPIVVRLDDEGQIIKYNNLISEVC